MRIRVLASLLSSIVAASGCGEAGSEAQHAPRAGETGSDDDRPNNDDEPIDEREPSDAGEPPDDGDDPLLGATDVVPTLDPTAVYLWGSWEPESFSWQSGLLPLVTQGRPARGSRLPPDVQGVAIRPTDGRLIYLGWRSREGTDLFVYADADEHVEPIVAPQSDAECDRSVRDFRLHPETGEVVFNCYACRDQGGCWPWVDQNGDIATMLPLLAVGHGDLLLAQSSPTTLALIDRSDDSEVIVSRLPRDTIEGDLRAFRAVSEGFFAAFCQTGREQRCWRWLIDLEGEVTEEGQYADPIEEYRPEIIYYAETVMDAVAIDAEGNLYSSGSIRASFDQTADVIMRRPLEPGETRVVYDERDSPWISQEEGPDFVYATERSSFATGP